MAEQGADAAPERRPLHHRIGHGARRFVKERPTTQKVGGLAAVALLVSAPFGGLDAEPAPQPAALHVGRAVDTGPFDIAVQKVVSLSSLSPTIKPARKGDRLLVVEALVRNATDAPQFSSYAGQSVVVGHAGVRPGDPQTYLVADASSLNEQVNPGLTYQVAFVFEQRGDWTPGADEPEVGVGRWVFRADDPLTLDPSAWDPDRLAVRGPVEVEVKS